MMKASRPSVSSCLLMVKNAATNSEPAMIRAMPNHIVMYSSVSWLTVPFLLPNNPDFLSAIIPPEFSVLLSGYDEIIPYLDKGKPCRRSIRFILRIDEVFILGIPEPCRAAARVCNLDNTVHDFDFRQLRVSNDLRALQGCQVIDIHHITRRPVDCVYQQPYVPGKIILLKKVNVYCIFCKCHECKPQYRCKQQPRSCEEHGCGCLIPSFVQHSSLATTTIQNRI